MNARSNDNLAAVVLADATVGLAQQQAASARAQVAADDLAEVQRLEEIERTRLAEIEANQRQQANRRRGSDFSAIALAGGAAVTVLGPYLLGHFVLRKTALLASDPGVYDERARGLGDHFLPDYLGGLAVVVALLAVFLLLRPWAFRLPSVILGWVLTVALFVILIPATMSQWDDAEAKTVASLRETSYPFAEDYIDCYSWDFDSENGASQRELWQVHLGRTRGTDVEGCNRINVYRGWIYVGGFDLGNGDTFTGDIVVNMPNWTEPFITSGSSSVYQISREPMNPLAVGVDLATEFGGHIRFTLDGAANNLFTVS